jgi:predicted nucleic acid-binding protein
MTAVFRVCLDLNVWVKQYLAEMNGLKGTAAQDIVEAVQTGRSTIGPIQLVVSHTMLSRLQDVLVGKGASPETADRLTANIAAFSRLGPSYEYPHLVFGGGVEPTRDARMPIYDPYDPGFAPAREDREDGRVLDTAIAGRADALVTENFRDFVHHADRVLLRNRVHVREMAVHSLTIVRTREAREWLRTGSLPTTLRRARPSKENE